MRRVFGFFLVILCLTGCSAEKDSVDDVMRFRQKLLAANGCCFQAKIFADYGDIIYTFTVDCTDDALGNLVFQVVEPESIQGIAGQVSIKGGKLTFDDTVLAFSTLADDQITPITAPWLMIRAIRSGYIRGTEITEDGVHMIVDDSYQEDALTLDVYFDKAYTPVASEILWRGKRIVSMQITGFHIL